MTEFDWNNEDESGISPTRSSTPSLPTLSSPGLHMAEGIFQYDDECLFDHVEFQSVAVDKTEQTPQKQSIEDLKRLTTPEELIPAALQMDAPHLNFPRDGSSRKRLTGKQKAKPVSIGEILHMLTEKEIVPWNEPRYAKHLAKRSRGGQTYFRTRARIEGCSWRSLLRDKAVVESFNSSTAYVKDVWAFMHTLWDQLYVTKEGQRNRRRIPLPDGSTYVEEENAEMLSFTAQKECFGVLMTFHTNFGLGTQEIRLLQDTDLSVKDVVQRLSDNAEYKKLYADFEAHITMLAKKVEAGVWSCCMELCTMHHIRGRIHLHGFLGADPTYGASLHLKTQRMCLGDVLCKFAGQMPHLSPLNCRGRVAKLTQITGDGAYYCVCPKLGSIFRTCNLKPFDDFPVSVKQIMNMWQQNKFDKSTAVTELWKTKAFGMTKAIDVIEQWHAAFVSRKFDAEIDTVRSMLDSNLSRFKTLPEVSEWKMQFDPVNRGKLHRFKMLLLRGGSQAGKTIFAKNIFGSSSTLVVNCQVASTALPSLRHFQREVHQAVVLDEVSHVQVLGNKALVQSTVEKLQLAQSQCGAHRYELWMYGVAWILCANFFPTECGDGGLSAEDAEWLQKNITIIDVPMGQKLFIE